MANEMTTISITKDTLICFKEIKEDVELFRYKRGELMPELTDDAFLRYLIDIYEKNNE